VSTAESVIWLREKLAKGPRRRDELITEAKNSGLAWPAVEAAKMKLGIVLVQAPSNSTAGRKPLAWATKEHCAELGLVPWKPGEMADGGKKRGPGRGFSGFSLEQSLKARGQRVMDDARQHDPDGG
jgi:hypothetical protein